MTPRRTGKGRGNFAFDRIFKGVGRITTTAETLDAKEFSRRNRMLDRLFEAGQLEALRLLKGGKISATELRAAQRAGRLNQDSLVADIALGRRLWDRLDSDAEVIEQGAFSLALPKMGKKESTRRRYAVSFAQLATLAAATLPDAARVQDLRDVAWNELLAGWDTSAANRNRLRAAVSRFLTVHLDDKWHPFRRDVLKRIPLFEEVAREVDLTPDQFWTLMAEVPDVAIASYVTLAASGMRVGEYLQALGVRRQPDRERIAVDFADGKGGKGTAYLHDMWWPYVQAAIPCRVAPAPKVWRGVEFDARYKRLRTWIIAAAEATSIDVWIHDLRHLYVQIGVDEVAEAKVQKAVRHKTASMTRRYAMRSDSGEVAHVVGRALSAARKRVHRRTRAS